MFRMEVYDKGRKTIILNAATIEQCLYEIKLMNKGIREVVEVEPSWSHASVWGFKGCSDPNMLIHDYPANETVDGKVLISL